MSCPSKVETATCFPSGRTATRRTSACNCNDSLYWLRLKILHSRTVWSQLPLITTPPKGANANDEIGASCPANPSSHWPVWTDQIWISNESREAAQTTSPLGSTARQEKDKRDGAVKVLKFRYLIKSQALIDPSRLEVKNTLFPFVANSQPVTPEECSVNVAAWNPD